MTAQTLESMYAPEIDSISATDPASHAKRRMDVSEARSLLVMDEGRLVGILRRNSLINLDSRELERPVADFMSPDVPRITRNQSLEEARQLVGDDINIAQIPVMNEEGVVVGVIDRSRLGTATEEGGSTHDASVASRMPVEEGMTVKDSSGSKLGTLAEATFRTDGGIEFMFIEYGMIFKKQKRLPGDLVDGIKDGELHLKLDSTEFGMMKDIDEE